MAFNLMVHTKVIQICNLSESTSTIMKRIVGPLLGFFFSLLCECSFLFSLLADTAFRHRTLALYIVLHTHAYYTSPMYKQLSSGTEH